MTKPPEDDRFREVLHQVSDALRSLGLVDEDARLELLEGVREALHSLVDGSDAPGDLVAVVDRGDPTDEHGPVLRVVDTEEVERILGRDDTETDMQLHLLRTTGSSTPLAAEGRIRAPWAEGERPWQTVYRGDTVRPYRVACDNGELELAVDGMTLERLVAGQTVDVEARVVRVRAAGGGQGAGRYVRLTA